MNAAFYYLPILPWQLSENVCMLGTDCDIFLPFSPELCNKKSANGHYLDTGNAVLPVCESVCVWVYVRVNVHVFALYLSVCANKTAQHDRMPLSQQSGKRPLQIYYAITAHTHTYTNSLLQTHTCFRWGGEKKKVVMAHCPSKDGARERRVSRVITVKERETERECVCAGRWIDGLQGTENGSGLEKWMGIWAEWNILSHPPSTIPHTHTHTHTLGSVQGMLVLSSSGVDTWVNPGQQMCSGAPNETI